MNLEAADWDEKRFSRLIESIPRISTAAAEFRHFAARKSDLDEAVSEYCKYCRETTFDSVQGNIMYPKMRKEGSLSLRERFAQIVEHLISFANDS